MRRYDEDEIEDSLEFCRDIDLYYRNQNITKEGKLAYEKMKYERKLGFSGSYGNTKDEINFDVSTGSLGKKGKTNQAFLKILKDGTICVAAAVCFGYFITKYVGVGTLVDGISMEDTLHDKDYIVIDKLSYHFRKPNRYDIIVFPIGKEHYIKRVFGLPGETVEIIDNQIYINGRKLKEEYKKESFYHGGRAEHQMVLLGEDEYFVMGDNRNHSFDSRSMEVGNIKGNEIVGQVFIRLYPLEKAGTLK